MQKICPVCGKKYSKNDNFCSKHSDLVRLVYVKDLVKICPKCGEKYTEEDNFCGFHDEAIELCYIKDLVKVCSACGSKYPESYNYCIKCEWDGPLEVIGRRDIDIKDIETNPNKNYNFKKHPNHFDTVEELFSPQNIRSLKEFDLTQSQFDEIIENIIKTYKSILKGLIDDYYIDFEGISILNKMFLFSKSFVKTYHKAGGRDLGHYMFNEIYVDDMLETALQISTIIHELSHFLFSEILEQIISTILDTDKTDIIEAYVYYILDEEEFNNLIDEYCAYTVEGGFVKKGFNDYGSYIEILKEFIPRHGSNLVEHANIIGNSFADYIKLIMRSFINDNLRREIKHEFSKLGPGKNHAPSGLETDLSFEWNEFKIAIGFILTNKIDAYLNDGVFKDKLLEYSLEFEKNNG